MMKVFLCAAKRRFSCGCLRYWQTFQRALAGVDSGKKSQATVFYAELLSLKQKAKSSQAVRHWLLLFVVSLTMNL